MEKQKLMKMILSYYRKMSFPILFVNAILCSILIVLGTKDIPLAYYLFSLAIFVSTLLTKTDNIIFFIRTFFLGIIGFLAISTKMIDPNAYFGFHMRTSQTIGIATLMFLLTNIALFSNELGLSFGLKIKVRVKESIRYENKAFFGIIFLLCLFVAYLLSRTGTGIIGTGGTYGSGDGAAMPINNLNSISNILFYTLILLYFKYKKVFYTHSKGIYYLVIAAGVILYLYAEFLRGVRMDALNGILGAIVLYSLYEDKGLKISPKIFFLGLGLFLLSQVMGAIRSIYNSLSPDEIYAIVINNFSYLLKNPNRNIMFYQGTLNDIATTFSGTIMFLENQIVDFMYGKSYFDYILRTPPQFIYPGRPQDLAWIFANNGYTSGGGFFELAEAYLNFSVAGAFIVPFFVSSIIAYAYKQFTLNKFSLFHSILLFSILAAYLRGLLYQTFAFWKATVTGFLLYLIFYFILGFINIIKQAEPE